MNTPRQLGLSLGLFRHLGFAMVPALLGGALFLGGCARRPILLQDATTPGITSTDTSTSTGTSVNPCPTNLTASIATPQLTKSAIVVGTSVTFQVQPSGCTGQYLVTPNIANTSAKSATASTPASFVIPFNSVSSSATVVFQIQSMNSSGTVYQSISPTSASLVVEAAPSCTAIPSVSTQAVPVNASGVVLNAASFSVQVSGQNPFSIYEADLNGSVESLNGIPTNSVTMTNLTVPVSQLGQSTLVFKIKDSLTDALASCSATVTTTQSVPCSAVPSQSSMNIVVNSAGSVLQAATFGVQVTTPVATSVYGVDLDGAAYSVSGVPTAANTSNSISVVVGSGTQAPGTSQSHSLTFHVKDPSTNGVNQCSASVSTVATQLNTPVITSFSASPASLVMGGSTLLSLQASGTITSATIDGTTVTLSGGKGSLNFTPSSTGASTHTAIVTNLAGSTQQTTTVTVNPTCLLTTTATSKAPGDSYPFSLVINGAFTSASLTAPGLSTLAIAGSNSLNQSLSTTVVSAAGAQTAQVDVAGPDGTSAVCSTPINTAYPTNTVTTCSGIAPTSAFASASTPFDFTKCSNRCGNYTPPPSTWNWTLVNNLPTWGWYYISSTYGYAGLKATNTALAACPRNSTYNYDAVNLVGLSTFIGGTSSDDLWLQTNQRTIHVGGGEQIKCANNADGVNEPFIVVANGEIRTGWVAGTPTPNEVYSLYSRAYPLLPGEIPQTFNISATGSQVKWCNVFIYSY